MARKIFLYLFLFLFISGVAPVLAMDQVQIIEYEHKLMEVMGTDKVDSLVANIAQLEKDLDKQEGLAYNLGKIRLGIYYHNLALNGFKMGYRGFAEKSFDTFRQIHEDPGCKPELRPIVLSYLGSSRAIMGDESNNPIDKIRFVQEGVAYLDEAVNKYKDYSYIPYFIRANVCIALPDFFGKEKEAFKDYSSLEQWYQRTPERIPAGIMSVVYFNLGDYHKKQRNLRKACDYWEKAEILDPDGEIGAQAREMLELFGG